MLPPMGGLLLNWSNGGGLASHTDWTSDESEAEEESNGEDGESDACFWTRDELIDRISQEVLNSPETKVEKKTRVSKAEAPVTVSPPVTVSACWTCRSSAWTSTC